MQYESPANLVELLDGVVQAAQRTPFYASRLNCPAAVRSLDDFEALPITPLDALRSQDLGDTLADPQALQWIAGRQGGQGRPSLPVAEGVTETAARYDLFRDALKTSWDLAAVRTAAIVTEPHRRHYAAEISAILGYMGIPAHVFIDRNDGRAYERVRILAPDVLVILADRFDERDAPCLADRAITFRMSHRLSLCRQLDFYVIDELGFLAHSDDLYRWTLYNDQYLYERSDSGNLVVTALHNRTQPMLRIEMNDTVESLERYQMTLRKLD